MIEVTTSPVVLMEFDDVLAVTRPHRLDALRGALAAEGATLSDEVFDTQCAGLSFAGAGRAAFRAARAVVDELSVELIALRADRTFGAIVARGLSLSPGAGTFVRNAAGSARLGIVTRAARRDVESVLALAGLGDAFECVVACEDYSGPEPSPDPFEQAVVRMARRSAVTIGDGVALVASLNGVAAARAARLHPIVVGPVGPALAFAGDAFLASLDGVRVRDLLRLSAGARST
jgi:beta-phosphoglucomutase-like phosphatase (HAD superfamily)